MIDELQIENFRGFRSLHLEELKRVNLVVGRNNSGKTSLLEALFLLCEPERAKELPSLLRQIQGNPNLRYFPWLLRKATDCRVGKLSASQGAGPKLIQELGSIEGPRPDTSSAALGYSLRIPFFAICGTTEGPDCSILSTVPGRLDDLVKRVGNAHRHRGGEEQMQQLLAKIDPRIVKVRIDPGEDGNQIILDIGLTELIPLSQAGQGVTRLVSILAEMIGKRPQILILDEIENGLHHTVIEQVWSGLAEAAESLDIQIFATTHSAECVEAADSAFSRRANYDLSVIQLFRTETEVQGRVLGRDLIRAAIDGNIDLR
jgi:energy-coupling factor transporter ATP-binding protein EcfA2